MSDYYCTVSVENSNVHELRTLIEEKIGEYLLDISLEIEDRSEIYSYTSKFMEENDLEEYNSVLRNIDLSTFTTDVDLYCTGSSFGLLVLDIMADALGCTISKFLNKRVLVTLTNQEAPFCIFESGFRKIFSTEENKKYFDKKTWIPSEFLTKN